MKFCFGEVDDEVSEMTEYGSCSEIYQVPRMPSVNAENDNTRLPRQMPEFCNNFSWNMDLNIMEYGCSLPEKCRKLVV